MDGRSGFRLRPLERERERARRGGSLLHFSSTQGIAASVYSQYAAQILTCDINYGKYEIILKVGMALK